MQKTDDIEEILRNMFIMLEKENVNGQLAIKVNDIYGSWGMDYVFHVGIYLWPVQLVVATVMFFIFKRRQLLGVTQKILILIMATDLCFTTISMVRDTLLKVFQLDYGFLEYRVCPEVLFSLRLQMVFHATSVWLNALMSLHHLLIVGFPLKSRMFNLSAFFFTFMTAHLLFCCIMFLFLMSTDHEAIPLVQEFRPGYSLKKIDGCSAFIKEMFGEYFGYKGTIIMAYIVVFYSEIIPYTVHFISSVGLVFFIYKNIRILSVLTNNVSVKRVKYIRLMAVNIGLGLSFLLQETPVLIASLQQFEFHEIESTHVNSYSSVQGVITSVISISYSIGKPLNLLIYANLSTTFNQELKGLLRKMCCQSWNKLIGSKKRGKQNHTNTDECSAKKKTLSTGTKNSMLCSNR